MGKFIQFKVTIGRTNIDGTFRTNTYQVNALGLKVWIDAWLNDRDAVSINIEGTEVKDA